MCTVRGTLGLESGRYESDGNGANDSAGEGEKAGDGECGGWYCSTSYSAD